MVKRKTLFKIWGMTNMNCTFKVSIPRLRACIWSLRKCWLEHSKGLLEVLFLTLNHMGTKILNSILIANEVVDEVEKKKRITSL